MPVPGGFVWMLCFPYSRCVMWTCNTRCLCKSNPAVACVACRNGAVCAYAVVPRIPRSLTACVAYVDTLAGTSVVPIMRVAFFLLLCVFHFVARVKVCVKQLSLLPDLCARLWSGKGP